MEYTEKIVEGYRLRIYPVNKLLIGIPLDIGPRILYIASLEKPEFNLFSIIPDISIETPEGTWKIHGGHRLWTSPEAMPRSYSLDDKPVELRIERDEIEIVGNPEHANNVLKKIRVTPGEEDYSVKVVHEIINIGRWPLEFSCWAISVMRSNGFAIIPFKPRQVDHHGLLPDRFIVAWPYTRLDDPRIKLRGDYIIVHQDPSVKNPVKIGVRANPPWIAYWVEGYLFKKSFREEDAVYPDFGSSVEVYTNDRFLELETLGPLRRIEPGRSNIHVETWSVKRIEGLGPHEKILEERLG